MSSKENLFKLIRNEEVVLWAGAGMSMYAGYPSGATLSKLILNELTPSDIEKIDSDSMLSIITEDLFRIHGHSKNFLIRILKKIFIDQQPTSLIHHEKLKIIPHIKTIITTNYDQMFEQVYGSEAQLIFNDNQVPYTENNKTQIIKIHGDLSNPDSIILTQSDYNNFFQNNREYEIIWSVIKERISTKCILFIGYNLEDPNVSIVFDRIASTLKLNRKECFLVAPKLPKHKISNLERQGVQYIDSTGEEIISELLTDIKENIVQDLEKGITSIDTFGKFLNNIQIDTELQISNNQSSIKSLKGQNNNIIGELNLKLKNESTFLLQLNEHLRGDKIGVFKVPQEKLLNAKILYGGVKVLDSKEIQLEIKSVPKFQSTVDIRFNDGFEIRNIATSIYINSRVVIFHLELNNALIKVNLDITQLPETQFKFEYIHNEYCNDIQEEIELYSLLTKFSSGEEFTVFTKTGETFTKNISRIDKIYERAETFLHYFTLLNKIEKFHKLKFRKFLNSTISDDSYEKIRYISSWINGPRESKWDSEIKVEIKNIAEIKDQLQPDFLEKSVFEAKGINKEVIEIHNIEINLGYFNQEIQQPYIANLDLLLSGSESIALIRSRNKKIINSYILE